MRCVTLRSRVGARENKQKRFHSVPFHSVANWNGEKKTPRKPTGLTIFIYRDAHRNGLSERNAERNAERRQKHDIFIYYLLSTRIYRGADEARARTISAEKPKMKKHIALLTVRRHSSER